MRHEGGARNVDKQEPQEIGTRNSVFLGFLTACGTAVIMACVYSGAIDAEIRQRDPPRKTRGRLGGVTVFLAWPKEGLKTHIVLICVLVCSIFLLPKHPCRKPALAIKLMGIVFLLYGPIVQQIMVQPKNLITDPGRLVLTWDQFASRHDCQIELEPAITRSLAPYREKCAGRISTRSIREAVKKTNGIGISVSNEHQTRVDGLVRGSQVTVIESDEAKGKHPTRLWHWFLGDLQALAEQVELPAVEFLVVLEDGFVSSADDWVPTFVQEKKIFSTGGVFAPPRSVRSLFDLDPSMSYLYDSNVKRATQANEVPFKLKQNKAFFRGSTTGGIYTLTNWRQFQRSKIVQLSLKRPDLLDARFTGQAGTNPAKSDEVVWADMVASGFTGPHVDQAVDTARYKLAVVPDGNSVPDRLMSLLASNVVVVKPNSVNREYWYDELVPWQHYVPFREDTSDLEVVLQEALANVSRLEYIAAEASRFVLRRLNPSSTACYWALLLREYQTLFTVTKNETTVTNNETRPA